MYFLICIPVEFVYRMHSGLSTTSVEAELGTKLIDVFSKCRIVGVILISEPFFSQNGHLLKPGHTLEAKNYEDPIVVHRDNASFECEWFY